MAKNKTVSVSVQYKDITAVRDQLLVLGVFESEELPKSLAVIDKITNGQLSKVYKLKDFSGKIKQSVLIYNTQKGAAERILLLGLGDKSKFEADTLRSAAAVAIKTADKIKTETMTVCMDVPRSFSHAEKAQVIAEGLIVGRYEYVEQFSKPSGKEGAVKATVLAWEQADLNEMRKGVKKGIILGEAQNFSRSIANKGGAEIYPQSLAMTARKMASSSGLKCKIFDDKELAKMQMGGILAVGQGSAHKPRLIMLEYNGRKGVKSPDLVVVGKAITFDSGGISLKPGENMQDMKFDKSGGCNALGIMHAIAALKPAKNVVALIPAAENMPDGNSYRPGDIVKTYSGKTVEIQNTDAEGRMILCDALHYAVKMLKPKAIIDMATLTGACVIALGTFKAGLFSNNDKIVEDIKRASKTAGEPVWHLPCDQPYRDLLKSECADMKNIGGRYGGSSSAAAFLREFVGEDIAWAHIDIAGVSDLKAPTDKMSAGATGYIVRTVLEYVQSM